MRQIAAIKCFIFLLGLCFITSLGVADDRPWQSVETRHAVVRHKNREDLRKFEKKIDYSPGESGLKWMFSSERKGNTVENVIRKVDALHERAQEILEMGNRSKSKVKINIYPDKKRLHKAYYRIYKKNTRKRAWYIYEYNTIYVNVRDLHEGMLAHELAHSIIDHYLSTRPPRATAEILARYVDKHLSY